MVVGATVVVGMTVVVADPEFELGIVVVLGRWGSGCRRAWLSEGLL